MNAVPFLKEMKWARRGPGIVIDAMPRIEYMKRMKEQTKMAKPAKGVVISEEIPLKKHDESGKTWVKFQRPKRWEQEQIDTLQLQSEVIWNTETRGEMRQRERVPLSVIESEMVAVCLVESNLSWEDTPDQLIFKPGRTCRAAKKPSDEKIRKAFYDQWNELDSDLADEIVAVLREWHPPFNWRTDTGED